MHSKPTSQLNFSMKFSKMITNQGDHVHQVSSKNSSVYPLKIIGLHLRTKKLVIFRSFPYIYIYIYIRFAYMNTDLCTGISSTGGEVRLVILKDPQLMNSVFETVSLMLWHIIWPLYYKI